jgi:uncharacterized protein (UPF0216 family)
MVDAHHLCSQRHSTFHSVEADDGQKKKQKRNKLSHLAAILHLQDRNQIAIHIYILIQLSTKIDLKHVSED